MTELAGIVVEAWTRFWTVIINPWVYWPLIALEAIAWWLILVRINEQSKGNTQ